MATVLEACYRRQRLERVSASPPWLRRRDPDMSDPQVGVDTEHVCTGGEKWLLCFGPPRNGPDLLNATKDAPAPTEELHRRYQPISN
ncbi:MAG: hypothetical protein ACRDGM_20890 [bacterium]